MPKLILIIFFSFVYQFTVHAQNVAVMEARVQVISGSSIQPIQQSAMNIDLQKEQFNVGSFSVRTNSSSEIHAHIKTETPDSSDNLFFNAMGVIDTVTESGEHLLSITASVKNMALQTSALRNVLMIVEYF